MSYLNKKEYLRELSDELRGYFKKKDVQNIIADYEEFFSAGISDGKSEIEICVEFGNAKELAREIAKNQTDAKRKTYNKKYIIVGSLAVVIVFSFFIINEMMTTIRVGDTSHRYSFFYELSKVGIFFVPLLILFLIKLYKKYEININEKILFIFACVPVVWGIIQIILFNQGGVIRFILFNHDLTYLMKTDPHQIMLNAINLLFLGKTISVFSIAIIIILNLRKEKPDYINIAPNIFILTGIYQIINSRLFLLVDMDDPNAIIFDLVNSLMPLCFCLVIAALLYLFSFWRKYLPKFKNRKGADK